MTTIPLQRLLRYREALDTVLGEMRTRYRREQGEAPSRLPLPRERVAYLTGIDRMTLERDLKALGFPRRRPILLKDFDTRLRQRLRSARAEKAVTEERTQFVLPAPDALAATFGDMVPDLPLARAREAAWDFAHSAEDEFLFGLAAFDGDHHPFVHQLETAKRVVEEMDGCALVADEVGLGKTITAGLILLELQARGLAESTLIIVPSNLRQQWHDELLEFFDFENAEPTRLDAEGADDLEFAPHLLIDLHRAKTADFSDVLLRREWDLVIIDEAHRLRNADTDQTRFCFSLRAARRVLLTATPVQNAALDIFNLVTQIRPGYLGTQKSFEDYYVCEDHMVRHSDYLQDKLKGVKTRCRRADTQLSFAERRVRQVQVAINGGVERQLHNEVLHFLQQVARHYAGGIELNPATKRQRQVQSIVVVAIQVLRQLASHPRAALKSLKNSMRKRLTAMPDLVRNQADIRRLDEIVEKYGAIDWAAGEHAKSQALVARLRRVMRWAKPKVIVYAEFLETVELLQRMIREALPELEGALYTFTGTMSRGQKDDTIEDFLEGPSPAVLLSTDCGGEGLNLQEAAVVANFDFPWNPMKVEQRIGRIDRVKQKRRLVYVWNFITPGTIEAYVYTVLQEKLNVCGDILGDFDSPLIRFGDFDSKVTQVMVRRRTEDLGIGHIILTSRDAADLEERLERIDEEPYRRSRRQYGRRTAYQF